MGGKVLRFFVTGKNFDKHQNTPLIAYVSLILADIGHLMQNNSIYRPITWYLSSNEGYQE